jgi:PAS domain S-box-containing protein
MSTVPIGRILVVDDEAELLAVLSEKLGHHGYIVVGCPRARDALRALQEQSFDVLLTDLMMPEMDGVALLRAALAIDPHLAGIIMTGQATVQTAVEALKVGALDYVLKPFKTPVLLPVLARALEVRRLRMENVQLRESMAIYDLCRAISFTADLQTILDKVADAALQQCDGEEASVMLPTPDGREFCINTVRGSNRGALLGERVPIDQGVAGWVARTREPLTLEGEVRDPRFAPLWPRPDIRSAISMPMLSGGKLVGVLNVRSTSRRQPFTLGQVKALSILASTGAAAIEGAALLTRLRASEARYRSIFENAVEGISQTTPTGAFVAVNPALAHMLGYASAEEMTAHVTNAKELYKHPEDRRTFRQMLEQHGTVTGFETCFVRRDGQPIWVSLNGRAVRDDTGAVTVFDCTAEDISARRQAEARLRKEKAFSDTLLESLPGVVYLINVQGRLVRWNRATEEVTGYSASELADMAALDFVPDDEKAYLGKKLETVFSEGRATAEGHIQSKDGRRTPFAFSGVRLQAEGETYCIGLGMDTSERKKLEEQLRQAQKMEAIGQLAGGVAHDFNNLLTVINGYSELLLGRCQAEDPSRELLTQIKKAGERAAALTRQLLAFSRKQVLQPQVVHLNTLIEELTKMLRRLIDEDVVLNFIPAPDLGLVKIDPGQFEQVLMNLVVNARDAMPTGGQLTLETRNVELDSADVRQHPEVQAGHYAVLSVTDTGHGMDEATRSRIFEPFFTTKGLGKGTGLGLATVFGIVRQSGGHIQVYSEVGRGTTFKIYLPLGQEAALPSKTSPSRFEIPKGTETVLLVEDEDGVRSLATLVLRSCGYTVLEAKDGQEALAQAQRHSGPIHLVVTDVVMPRMSGRQLADQLAAARPDTKTLFVSGYTDEAVVRHGLLDGSMAFLQKPFSATLLACKIREVLDGRSP